MEAEANALQKLAAATAKLEKFEKTYGDLSSLPPDVAQLAEKIRVQDEEINRLRLMDAHHIKVRANDAYARLVY